MSRLCGSIDQPVAEYGDHEPGEREDCDVEDQGHHQRGG
jgi:hypothetical protein